MSDYLTRLVERSLGVGEVVSPRLQSLFEPRDEPYGDRVGGVTDPAGNTWYIATHIKDVTM